VEPIVVRPPPGPDDQPIGPGDLLTVEAAARFLGVSRHKVGRLIRSGDLVPYVDPLDRRRRLVLRRHLDRLRQPRAERGT